jgi:putative transcriptional regulator
VSLRQIHDNPRGVQHHPADEQLLAYAAGTLGEAASIVIATHVTVCRKCRASIAAAETAGGALFEKIQPAAIDAKAMATVMARLDQPVASSRRGSAQSKSSFPRTLDHYMPRGIDALNWRWVGPGLNYAELLNDDSGKVGLMRIAEGASVPVHTHSSEELTMVLEGGYGDGAQSFWPGDVQYADGGILHQPIANQDGGCTALIMTNGRLRPSGLIAKFFMPLVGM